VFLGNAVIGLREGLESGIVVMAIVAYLSGRGRPREIRLVWTGVVAAAVACLGIGAILAATAAELSGTAQEVFDAVACTVAIVFITGMILWMRHSSQDERRELEGKLSRALRGGPMAVLAVAFLTVLREGFEASVFVVVLSQHAGSGAATSILGLLSGLVLAVGLVWMLHSGLIRMDIARFLNITGVLLVVIGAGILAHLVTALQALRLLPGASSVAFDVSSVIPVDSWYGDAIAGLSGISSRPTVFALVAWSAYVVAVLAVFRFLLRMPAARQPLQPTSADR
jgi:high-affinity iron transporter